MRPPTSVLVVCGLLVGCGAGSAPDAASSTGEEPPGASTPDPAEASAGDAAPRTLAVEVRGTRLVALEAGPARGEGVLLLHGARFSSRDWRELGTLARLAGSGRRVVALDLPGKGGSAAPSPEAEALPRGQLLLEILDALALPRAVVVAPSYSGCFLLPLVVDHPERVAGAVPIAPACADELTGDPAVPALVLWGEEDRLLPASGARELSGRWSGARVELFPGAGHPCYLEDPERFHRVLQEFLEHVLGG
jgi:abhydrolase domain-containing protein 14